MPPAVDFATQLEEKVAQQLKSQRIGYLLGAGTSYLEGAGYPLAAQLWDLIKGGISDGARRDEIQAKLDAGVPGLEAALDLLDDGGVNDTAHRHLATAAIAKHFMPLTPALDLHCEFATRLAQRADPSVRVFSLNYDPMIERAAARARVRVADGFLGAEHSYFSADVFEERIGRIRGTHKAKQFDETVKPIHLLKLHGSLGWYECPKNGVRRCGFSAEQPTGTKRLMIPPQKRKATDTMYPPYASLWSTFRGALSQSATPLNRLVCLGYGFADEHVNAVIDAAMGRTDFTLLALTKSLGDPAWNRWSTKSNVVIVTEDRSSLKGVVGPGHPSLWDFKRIAKEI
jgi:hypothetical protein